MTTFILVSLIVFLGVPSLLLYFLYKWLAKMGYKLAGMVIVLSSIAFIFFNIYTAIYPSDSFYFDDFKKITSKEIPNSASIIKKTASYPDLHGTYISCSLIQLSKQDYTDLLTILNKSKNLIKNPEIIYSNEFNEVMEKKNIKDIKAAFARNKDGYADDHSYIGFFNDDKTILVYLLN